MAIANSTTGRQVASMKLDQLQAAARAANLTHEDGQGPDMGHVLDLIEDLADQAREALETDSGEQAAKGAESTGEDISGIQGKFAKAQNLVELVFDKLAGTNYANLANTLTVAVGLMGEAYNELDEWDISHVHKPKAAGSAQ